MAEKKVPLTIFIKAVDGVTAKVAGINAKLEKLTGPIKGLQKEFKNLRDNLGTIVGATGIPAVVSGFRGVGGAVKDLLGKIAVVGGATVGAVVALKSMVDEFDGLGDKAEKLGVGVDFLASMRHAAEQSGASVEELDSGLTAFVQNLGQLRAGKGRLKSFLDVVSPALRDQLKEAKSNEQAFDILAGAMAKLDDPAKRLTLASKAADGALAPLLAKGPKGVAKLRAEFLKLAGSQEKAAGAAGDSDTALKKLKAATTGVKAALVTGLAPALTIVVGKLSDWLVDHRDDIERWAIDIGTKLPVAVDNVVKSIAVAVKEVTVFVEDIGGLDTVAIAVGVTLAGPLLGSIVTLTAAIVKMGAAARTTTGLMGGLLLAGAVFQSGTKGRTEDAIRKDPRMRDIIDSGRADRGLAPLTDEEFLDFQNPGGARQRRILGHVRGLQNLHTALSDARPDAPLSPGAASGMLSNRSAETRVIVEFANAPRGLRTTTDPRGPADVETKVGFNMLGSGL